MTGIDDRKFNYPLKIVYHRDHLAHQATLYKTNDVLICGDKRIIGLASDHPECFKNMDNKIIHMVSNG